MTTGELLFTYGSLQRPEVQLDTFGRLVHGDDDVLPGYTVDYAEIEDHRDAEGSAPDVHPILRATGNPLDKVVGKAVRITESELDASDEYQVTLYRRVSVELASGHTAWVYIAN